MLKSATKSVIAKFGRQHWRLHKNELLVLMYHRVLPYDYPNLDHIQPGMWVHPETLRAQLKVLKTMYELVPLNDSVAAHRNGQTLPRQACAIAFDDGWPDHFRQA